MNRRATVVARGLAGLDLGVTLLLALPPTAKLFVSTMYWLDGLGGRTVEVPAFPAFAWFFMNLGGVLGVLWAVVRLMQPSVFLMKADAYARCVVSLLIVGYVAGGEIPLATLSFLVTEFGGGLVELWAARGQSQA